MAKVSITIPDIPRPDDPTYDQTISDIADTLRDVADLVDEDFTSGYLDGKYYWSIEEEA